MNEEEQIEKNGYEKNIWQKSTKKNKPYRSDQIEDTK